MSENDIRNTLLLSDSWAWTWYPTAVAENQEHGIFHSKRYQHALTTVNASPSSFPIVEVLLNFYGYSVKNLGDPGSSNLSQIEFMESYLELSHEEVDAVIMIHTDPLRDVFTQFLKEFNIDTEDHWEQLIAEKVDFGSWSPEYLEQLLDHTSQNLYTRMFRALQKHNLDVPVLFLGGCGTVQPSNLEKAKTVAGYHNAHLVCENILAEVAYQLTAKPTVMPHAVALNRLAYQAQHNWNRDLLNFLYEIDWGHLQKENPIFSEMTVPDGRHPNAGSWIVMTEILCRFLEKL